MKTFIDYLHEARTEYDPRDARYWLLNEIIADMEKEPDHQVHTLEAKAYATTLVQKFMSYDNDLTERQRYDYAIFSAEIHVLQLFNPRLPMDIVRYYQQVLNELKKKKNGR